ncbi:hypothetical protein SAMN02745148_01699 [Modicisalibacter ilicicola DSM 19980]|uniref:Uncharacterized protein n=1 Tax=Modicisalibacter ilicicola DSM 19980 TaxID=1121942 RepID=A0A1M4YFX4_9GAMM|nr:hypothetical protein SAMN02745148_01699 [Halomonas ilicicola DSM 19980]
MHNQNRSKERQVTPLSNISLAEGREVAMTYETKEMLDCLRAVAVAEIERKRRLGHYVVVWQNKRPVLIGEDAPLDP